jgi:hypothetical protein
MTDISDEELMAAVRLVSPTELDAELRACVRKIERAGSRVSMFEVLGTRRMFVVGHVAPRAAVSVIRAMYEKCIRDETGLS